VSDQRAVVTAIYDAFGRGDIPAILDHLADDIEWEPWEDNRAQAAGVPWMKARADRAGVLEFFKVISAFQFRDFRVHAIMVGDNRAAAEISLVAVLPNGRQLRDEEVHVWTFNDAGKIVRFRHYLDTAKHVALAAPGQGV
jgi:ketosteroid isomerase-like protein